MTFCKYSSLTACRSDNIFSAQLIGCGLYSSLLNGLTKFLSYMLLNSCLNNTPFFFILLNCIYLINYFRMCSAVSRWILSSACRLNCFWTTDQVANQSSQQRQESQDPNREVGFQRVGRHGIHPASFSTTHQAVAHPGNNRSWRWTTLMWILEMATACDSSHATHKRCRLTPDAGV